MEAEANFFESKAISSKVHLNTETGLLSVAFFFLKRVCSVFPCFLTVIVGLWKHRDFSPELILPMKTSYTYLSLFTDCWNI